VSVPARAPLPVVADAISEAWESKQHSDDSL
jgi:hypothetical protein